MGTFKQGNVLAEKNSAHSTNLDLVQSTGTSSGIDRATVFCKIS